jgi:hypothetical protein
MAQTIVKMMDDLTLKIKVLNHPYSFNVFIIIYINNKNAIWFLILGKFNAFLDIDYILFK